MESERSYSAVNYSARSLKVTGTSGEGLTGGGMRGNAGMYGNTPGFLDTLLGKYGGSTKAEGTENEGEDISEKKTASVSDIMNDMMVRSRITDSENAVRDPATDIYVRRMSVLYIFSILFEDFKSRLDDMMAGLRSEYEGKKAAEGDGAGSDISGNIQGCRVEISGKNYFCEKESTSFHAKGIARCADGREISFDINAHMSREFEKVTRSRMKFDPVKCLDPLVINLNEGVTSVSGQDFYFDLDCDGEPEKIRSLSEGSGFLALDKNGDGTVNDGSELFGTKSGDGFADLEKYDDDGDGWIDEDDNVFDRLRIWIRSEDGTENLISLKEAGVGAINLARAQTEFSLKDKLNRTEAVIRATGMFLYEDGRAGTMQQVDMVS